MIRIIIFSIFSVFLISCQQENPDSKTQNIVKQTMAAHGSDKLLNQDISFTFRKKQYGVKRTDNQYIYTHSFKDTVGQMEFELINSSEISAKIDGTPALLNTKQKSRFKEGINSVLYFLQLPYGLNDQAVNKKYEGTTKVKGKDYELISVTFKQEGGGKDFQDEYLYWISKETNKIDFLAYNYIVNGGGVRFREAINRRTINGITFQDYINYMPSSKKTPLKELDDLFEKGQLKELSRILSEDITVSKL